MLDPLTAISLASAVVQFTDFGIKVVTESLKLYRSSKSDLEPKIARISLLADKIITPLKNNNDGRKKSRFYQEIENLAETCKSITTELLSIFNGLKANKPAGPGRMFESFQKAIAAQTPWNKKLVTSLEKELSEVQKEMFHWIQLMMR